MKAIVFLFSTLLLGSSLYAQDFLLLKKRNKTVQSFYPGYAINFRIKSGEWINAYIHSISHDTLQLNPFELVQYVNNWSMPVTDTLFRNKRKVAVADITAFPRKNQSANYIKNGFILQLGAGGYIVLNVINTLSSGDQLFDDNNGIKLGIAALVFAIGTLMHTSRSPVINVGKKYRLQYINLSDTVPVHSANPY